MYFFLGCKRQLRRRATPADHGSQGVRWNKRQPAGEHRNAEQNLTRHRDERNPDRDRRDDDDRSSDSRPDEHGKRQLEIDDFVRPKVEEVFADLTRTS